MTKRFALCPVWLRPVPVTGCAPRTPEATAPFELTVLHSNDTHSYLAGRDEHGKACFSSAPCVGGAARMATVLK